MPAPKAPSRPHGLFQWFLEFQPVCRPTANRGRSGWGSLCCLWHRSRDTEYNRCRTCFYRYAGLAGLRLPAQSAFGQIWHTRGRICRWRQPLLFRIGWYWSNSIRLCSRQCRGTSPDSPHRKWWSAQTGKTTNAAAGCCTPQCRPKRDPWFPLRHWHRAWALWFCFGKAATKSNPES